MSSGLAGKTALITGGSRGIGEAIAFAMAGQGANVVISSRKQEGLDAVAEKIRAAHGGAGVLAKAAHVADAEQAQAAVDAAYAEFGGIDVLVNNAGTNPYFGPLIELDQARADKTVQVNQWAGVLWTQLVWRASMSERGGSVVNIASIGGMSTEPGIGYYNATKSAVIHLTRQLAFELAPRVRVNAIAPGLVRTQLARALWESHEEHISQAMPLGRIGEPEDIAKAVVFLAGEDSSWITGQSIIVDGGAMIRPQITQPEIT
ncbi:MAG: SDR family oxidoreductase [Pseudonocardiaceae bacterium]